MEKSNSVYDTSKIGEWASKFMHKHYGLQVVAGDTKVACQNADTNDCKVKYLQCDGDIYRRFAEIRGAKRELDIILAFLNRSLLKMPIPDEDLIKMSLFNSITVLYGKIFSSNSRSRPIPDPSVIYTQEEYEIHKELVEIRNTVIAHSGDNNHEVNNIHFMIDENNYVIGYLMNFVDIAFLSYELLDKVMTMVTKVSNFYDDKSKRCMDAIYRNISKENQIHSVGEIEQKYVFNDFHSKVFSYTIKFESAKYDSPFFKLDSIEGITSGD